MEFISKIFRSTSDENFLGTSLNVIGKTLKMSTFATETFKEGT